MLLVSAAATTTTLAGGGNIGKNLPVWVVVVVSLAVLAFIVIGGLVFRRRSTG